MCVSSFCVAVRWYERTSQNTLEKSERTMKTCSIDGSLLPSCCCPGSASQGELGDDSEPDGSDVEAQQSVLKQVKFPEPEKDKPLYSLVPSISLCITKRLDKLNEDNKKLLAVEVKTDLHTRPLLLSSR